MLGQTREDGGLADTMSLRDYFAAQAVIGLVGKMRDKEIADAAYVVADALLERRKI